MNSEENKKFRIKQMDEERQDYLMKEILNYKIFKEKRRWKLVEKIEDAILNGWQPLSCLIINKIIDNSTEINYEYVLPVVIYREDSSLDINRKKIHNYEIIEKDVYHEEDIEMFQDKIAVSISNQWQPFGDLIILDSPDKHGRKNIYNQAVVHYDMKGK